MSPRYDWWGVQAIHPDKAEGYDVYIRRFPSLADALRKMPELEAEGYRHVKLIEPDHIKRQREMVNK